DQPACTDLLLLFTADRYVQGAIRSGFSPPPGNGLKIGYHFPTDLAVTIRLVVVIPEYNGGLGLGGVTRGQILKTDLCAYLFAQGITNKHHLNKKIISTGIHHPPGVSTYAIIVLPEILRLQHSISGCRMFFV